MIPSHSGILAEPITIFPSNKLQRSLCLMILFHDRIFTQNSFQSISVISSLFLFLFTGVIFGVFDIIYFRLALKAQDIGRFLW